MKPTLSRAQEKMRHRRRDFVVPLYQSHDAGQSIAPDDVKPLPAKHKTTLPIATPTTPHVTAEQTAVSGPSGVSNGPQHATPSLPARMARYDARVKARTADASAGTAATGTMNAPAVQTAAQQRSTASLAASESTPALRAYLSDAMRAGRYPTHAPARIGTDVDVDVDVGSMQPPGWLPPIASVGDLGAESTSGLTPEKREQLLDALAQRLSALGAPPGGAVASHGALIASALAQAGVASVGQATRILNLITVMPLSHIVDIINTPPQARATPDDRLAVDILRILSRGNRLNFDALRALRVQGGHDFQDDSQAHGVHTLLSASDYLATSQSALGHRTQHAAARLLRQGPDALTPAEMHDVFNWRQGDRTDTSGTTLSRKQHRLAKFTHESIGRVGESRMTRFRHAPQRLLGQHKSALTAATLGLGAVPRDTLAKEQAALSQAMRDTLTTLTTANGDAAPVINPANALRHVDPVGSLFELATLHIWLGDGGFEGGKITDDALHRVTLKAHALADAGRGTEPLDEAVRTRLDALMHMPADALRRTPELKSTARRHFSAEHLERWGKTAHIPRTNDSTFWANVDRIKERAAPPPMRLQARQVDDARELLIEAVGQLKGGARLRLSDGHRYGVSTRGLSVLFSNALHLSSVPMSVQANLRATKGREAVVEISRSTHGIEIFIGTAEQVQTHADAGVFLGYKFDIGLAEARAGGAVNVLMHTGERSKASGVTIGIARPINDAGNGYRDDEMLQKATDIIAALFDEHDRAHAPAPAPGPTPEDAAARHAPIVANIGNAPGLPLAQDARAAPGAASASASASERMFARYFDDPGLSVAWTDTSSSSNSAGLSGTVGITLRLPEHLRHIAGMPGASGVDGQEHTERTLLPLGIGPTAGLAYIRDYGQRQDMPALRQASTEDALQGQQQVEVHRAGGGSRLVGRLGLGASSSTAVGNALTNVDGSSAGREWGLGVLSLDTPAITVAFHNERMSAKLQLVRDNGKLNHRACMMDREFASPSAYIQAIESERPQWARLYATENTPVDEAPSVEALAAANRRIDRHIEKARTNWRPNQTLFTRHRLREHAARALDLNAALRDQAPLQRGRINHKEQDKRLAEADARILENPSSYIPIELKGKDTTGGEQLIGLNAFAHLGTRKAVAATREFVADNVSFASMDRFDRSSPR